VGRSVTFSSLPYKPAGPGVSTAPITAGDLSKMSAQVFRLDPGAKLDVAVPDGSDGYLFMLTGDGRIAVNGSEKPIERESFAAVSETQTFSLANTSAGLAEVVYVLAPPPGSPREHTGLAEPLAVTSRAAAPTPYIADQKKNRRYFVAKEASKSERGHAMIVEYEKDTETVMHHHPNAESMFVVLTGDIRFVVDGRPTVLSRGQAVYFPMNNRHALRCNDGTTSASFLEFHIPGAFTTVKEAK
jgi:mannose-6-phosphate isomerase-like protein (cupin superfamily)